MKNLYQYILESLTEKTQIGILAKYIYDTLYDYISNNLFNDEDVIEIKYKDIKGFDPTKYGLVNLKGAKSISKKTDIYIYFERSDRMSFGHMIAEFGTMMLNPIHLNTVKKIKRNKVNIMNTLMHELTHFIQFHKFGFKIDKEEKKKDLKSAMTMDSYDDIISNVIKKDLNPKKLYYFTSFIIYALNSTESDARVMGFIANLDSDWNKLIKRFKKENKNKLENEQKEFNATNFINYIIKNEKYDNLELHVNYFNNFLKLVKEDTWKQYYKDYEELDLSKHNSPIYVYLNLIDHRSNLDNYDGLTLPLPSKDNCTSYIQNETQFNEFKNKFIKSYELQYNRYIKKLTNKIYQKWESEYEKVK